MCSNVLGLYISRLTTRGLATLNSGREMLFWVYFVWDYDGTYNDLHNAYLKEDIKIKMALNHNYRVDIKVLCSIIQ